MKINSNRNKHHEVDQAMKEAVRSGRRANFYITENSFIDHYAREVGPVGIAVYHVLERHMNCETRSTWIGTARMAELLNLSQRTIQRSLKTLEDLKLIRIFRTANMTTYVIVPVPPRAKTATVIPLFDQIPDAVFSEEEESTAEEATPASSFTTPLSFPTTPKSHATTTASHLTTPPSSTRDNCVTAYKEEQNSLDKTQEQDGKPSPALQKSARQMIAMLGLPVTDSNCKMIEAALVAETDYTGQSLPEAAELIAKAAICDRERGIPINKFYFEDAKWRHSRASGGHNGRLSRAEQRKLDNLEVNARVKQRFRDLLGNS
jgi:hypothetical protein